MSTTYEAVIGLEVHVQLATQSKLFCGCSTQFGGEPNSNICPVCTGQPGVLPVLNQQVVAYAVKMALATKCQVRRVSRFARKNYFYPDLPKGYQISQYDEPIAEHGQIEIWEDGKLTPIGITRIHLEEDAGKTIHEGSGSLVDLNRACVPLIEIVSEPEIRSPEQAAEYMRTMRAIVRAVGVSDGNMEQGSLRCDANVSVRPCGQTELGTKTEIKNLNSFRFVQKALEYEIERQIAALGRGEAIVQETRLWDTERGVTESMRSKEEAHDYRYFPEPDLPPVEVSETLIEQMGAALPELPLQARQRIMNEHGLSAHDASELTRETELTRYFDVMVAKGAEPKRAANWIMTEVLAKVADPRDVCNAPVSAAANAELLVLVSEGKLNLKLAKSIWPKMWETGKSARQIAEEENLFVQTDSGPIEQEIDKLIAENADKVQQYREGKTKVFGWFVGQVMRATRGQASPQVVNELLQRKLDV